MTSYVSNRASQAQELSESGYIRAIAFFTMVMTLIVGGGAYLAHTWDFSWPLLIATVVAALAGILIFTISDYAPVSFIGVSVLSASLGVMMGPMLSHYSLGVILHAGAITAVILVIMSMLGIMFPAVFRGWGIFLLAGLTALLVAQFAQIGFVAMGYHEAANMPVVTWVGIVIFVGYVAYDWSQALSLAHTWDNAIDTSGSIILDAVNLFLRILELTSDSSSSSD